MDVVAVVIAHETTVARAPLTVDSGQVARTPLAVRPNRFDPP
jgi:hypothetical protein